MSDEWSTITLRKKTMKRIELLKVHPKQSYDEVLTEFFKNKRVMAAYHKVKVK